MEIKNNLNPMFYMSVDKCDGTKARMCYDLTKLTRESIQEMSHVFAKVNEYCPNILMWFTLGRLLYDETGKNRFTGETPIENTENKL